MDDLIDAQRLTAGRLSADRVAKGGRVARDLLAVALIVVGVGVVLTAAYQVDPRLALALAGVLIIVVGVIIGTATE